MGHLFRLSNLLVCDIDEVIVAAAARDPYPPASLIMQHCNQSPPCDLVPTMYPKKYNGYTKCVPRNLIKFTSDTEKNLYSIKDTIFINQFPPELNVNK